MSRDERNVRYDTMITEHQLTGPTAYSEETRKCYKDKFTYLNLVEIHRSLLKCEVINYCKVMIYHQTRLEINKIWHTITVDGSKSRNVVTIQHKCIILSKISLDNSYLNFKLIYISIYSISILTSFYSKGTFGCQLDINVTDKGYLQNAMPDKNYH